MPKGDGAESKSLYDSILPPTKAAYWLATSETTDVFRVCFPLIIFKAPMFSYSLAEDGDALELQPLTATPLRFARQLGGRKVTVVDVVAADVLDQYVQESAEMAKTLAEEARRKWR
jgi:hypothetical protein